MGKSPEEKLVKYQQKFNRREQHNKASDGKLYKDSLIGLQALIDHYRELVIERHSEKGKGTVAMDVPMGKRN